MGRIKISLFFRDRLCVECMEKLKLDYSKASLETNTLEENILGEYHRERAVVQLLTEVVEEDS